MYLFSVLYVSHACAVLYSQMELSLAGRFLEARRFRGWTQIEAASVIGVDPATWRAWERGRRIPKGPAIRFLESIESEMVQAREGGGTPV
jgi:DNA-binding transcriptional regulator YiaG